MIEIQCAICKEKEETEELYSANFDIKKVNHITFSARRIPDRSHYRIVRCLRCGLIFSNPILSLKKIFALYKKSGFNYKNESNYLKKTYGLYLKKILVQGKLRLLEIGCGNGFFLEEARRLGVNELFGVEPSKDAVKQASSWLKKNIKIDFFRQGLFKRNSFDIICSFHTLDHIIDPNSFIRECHQLLKEDGKIFFVVHNSKAWSAELLGERSPIFDIEHIFLFNPTTLAKMLKKNGFTKIQVFDLKNTYPLAYWMRMLPLPTTIKKHLLLLFKLTKLDIVPVTMRAGNIGVVAQK